MKIPTSPLLLTLPFLTGTLSAPLPNSGGPGGSQSNSPNIDDNGASPRIGGSNNGRFDETSWSMVRGSRRSSEKAGREGNNGWKEGLEAHRFGKIRMSHPFFLFL